MFARDLMTSSPALITASATVRSAAEVMHTRDVGLLPVVDDLQWRRLVGVLTDRDIVLRYVAPDHGPSATVAEHMTRTPLITVTPDAPAGEVIEKMARYQVRRLPVIDDRGVVLGVIGLADLAQRLGPDDPRRVEHLLEAISRPGALIA